MKKSLLALSLTVLLFSCKKETKTEFTATDVTGTTIVKGTCIKSINIPDGSGGWTTGTVPAANVAVSVKVNKSELYPNSIAQGADIYSAVTDAQGNYAISVKTNATGVNAWMTISGFTGTHDTLINGVTKTGLYANFFGSTNNLSLWMGMTVQRPTHTFNPSNLSSNPNNIVIGSAIVSGSVSVRHILKTVVTGTAASVVFSNTNIAMPSGSTVYMSLDKDPTTLAPKMYTATTDANGRYSFTFPTVANGTAGFNQNASLWVADYAASQDTIQVINNGAPTTITGKSGVFNSTSTNQNALYSLENRNATNMALNVFTAN